MGYFPTDINSSTTDWNPTNYYTDSVPKYVHEAASTSIPLIYETSDSNSSSNRLPTCVHTKEPTKPESFTNANSVVSVLKNTSTLLTCHVTHTTRLPETTVHSATINSESNAVHSDRTITPIAEEPHAAFTTTTTTINKHRKSSDKKFNALKKSSYATSTASNSTRKQPGYAFIFNHESFDNPRHEYRVGSGEDTIRLQQLFQEYCMEVEVYPNYTVENIKKAIEIISNLDYTNRSCLIIALLSHGNRNDVICAKNGTYSVNDDMLFPILRNPTLIGKPKIFLIQACKGQMQPEAIYTDSPGHSTSANEVLKFYSTFEGFVAYRSSNGSVFISTLCKYLRRYGYEKDISEIIKKVIEDVKEQTRGQQIPSITSTLTIPFKIGDYVLDNY